MKSRLKTNGIGNFILFFLIIAFIVTCNFLLFLHTMSFDQETISGPAKATLVNILLLTFLFCVIDGLRRRRMIFKPVKRIQTGIDRVISGDYSVRIDYIHGENSDNEFDMIIAGLNKMIE